MSELLGVNFDYFGRGWSSDNSSYKGVVKDKFEVISKYKFTFVIENCVTDNGYVLEEILDCFQARTVPVYL